MAELSKGYSPASTQNSENADSIADHKAIKCILCDMFTLIQVKDLSENFTCVKCHGKKCCKKRIITLLEKIKALDERLILDASRLAAFVDASFRRDDCNGTYGS